jgi:ADP-ribose pyrophosphatase YjhB (NUDIX family)
MNGGAISDARAYPSRPWIGLGVVVFKGEHLLLVRRARPPQQDTWSIPGGAQHVGETLFEAATREVLEETALTVRAESVITAVDAIDVDDAGGVAYHYTIIDILAVWESGVAEPRDDISDLVWVRYDELGAYDLWPPLRRVLAQAMELHGRRST